MGMRLTVHIGTTKTGSTSIQAFLRTNRAALLSRGISVPESLGQQDHRHAALSCLNFGQSADLMARQGLTDAPALQAFRFQTRTAFRDEMAAARSQGVREVVITSEHLQSRCNEPRNVERFCRLFAEGFDEIRILAYVRPQLDQMISLHSTTLRNGFADTIEAHVERNMAPAFFRYYDLAGLLERWGGVFGSETLMVRPYKALPPQDQGGVVADFCALMGLRHDAEEFASPVEANTSINAQGQELLRLFNLESAAGHDLAPALEGWLARVRPEAKPAKALRRILTAPGLTVKARRARLIHWVEAQCSGRGAEIGLDLARRFQSQFDAGNAAVIARYFPDHPDYLEPRWPRA
jgi:hypothetical protein